jgi:hypothetical protein
MSIELLGGIFLLVIVLEIVMCAKWWPPYFRYGLPLFHCRPSRVDFNRISARWLAEHHVNAILVPLMFRRVSYTEIAFREKFPVLRLINFTPLLHGIIRKQEGSDKITITGYPSWAALAFMAGLINLSARNIADETIYLKVLAVTASVFFIIMFIQYLRFRRIVALLNHYC